MTDKIRIGTRGSPLALAQARETRSRLMQTHGLEEDRFEIVVISTTGDQIRDRPLAEIGGKGLFTKEIEEALLADAIDLAVHSMKDMPAVMPDGLSIAAVLPREDARDALLSPKANGLLTLPRNAVLGSSSVRRNAQALRVRPDLKPVQFRGNVETRLRKLQDGVADATFLAVAGLRRLGLAHHISAIIEIDEMLPAVAQGAIGIQTKTLNSKTRALVDAIHHSDTGDAIACERAFLATLEGSCRTPIAGHATLSGNRLSFRAQALTLDGVHSFDHKLEATRSDAAAMGTEAGQHIKQAGGKHLIY
jgi:hydroxymethylbilane synthase